MTPGANGHWFVTGTAARMGPQSWLRIPGRIKILAILLPARASFTRPIFQPVKIRRLLPHAIWLLACVGTWFAARHSGGDSEGKRVAVIPGGSGNATGRKPETAPASSQTVAAKDGAVSSSLDKDFDFPAEWDACECVREALGELNEFRRMQKFQRAMQRLTPETAARMQSVFSENDLKGRWYIGEYAFFLRRWGEIDGRAAMAFSVNRGGGDPNGWYNLMRQTLTGWAVNDPDGAVKWMNDSTDIPDWIQRASMQGVVDALTEKSPDQAISFALSQAEDPARDSLWSTLTEGLIYGPGLAKAEAWLAQIPNAPALENARQRVFSQIVDRHLRGGADGAAALIAKHAAEPWVDTNSVGRVARSMQSDPQKLSAWIATLPEGRVRDAASAHQTNPR